MSVQIAFLRGVGHGPDDMLDMVVLREALSAAGFNGPRTHQDGGNVVVDSDQSPQRLAQHVHAVFEQRFGRDVHVIVHSREELADVVARDPFQGIATDLERYNVAFLDGPLGAGEAGKLEELAVGGERVTVIGRELYAGHPGGPAGSRLVAGIMALDVPATARTWATVSGLLELTHEAHAVRRYGR